MRLIKSGKTGVTGVDKIKNRCRLLKLKYLLKDLEFISNSLDVRYSGIIDSLYFWNLFLRFRMRDAQ